ncbi:MAG: substrate-binding domain-containing protein, partial [Gammaproteobacteria bacterium]|nr:substrate-binding domain-containing protein [Gammaproteobacteria bacterium]
LKNAGIPVVQIMEIEQEAVDSCVGVDHFEAGALMARHFLQRGYRRIGYVGCSNRDLTAAKRFQGFRKVLRANSLEVEGIMEFDQPVGVQRGKQGLAQLLSLYPQLDAVYFANDIAAIGGYFHCLGAGIEIPTQLAIGGFSGLQIGQLMPVPLTTVKIDRFEIGRRSAGIIVDRLNGKQPQRINTVDISLIKAETT